MPLLEELKRRNVFRVALAYLALAWLLVQVAETVLPVFGFSEAALRVVFILLAIGLVPSLVFAWVFEITPEGIKRETEIDRALSITPRTGKSLDRIILVVLAIAVSYFLVDKFVLDPSRDAAELEAVRAAAEAQGRIDALQSEAPANSIAVLPFLNRSKDEDNEYFADGVSEELLNLLAQTGGLVVASRTSCFYFKNKDVDIRQVADRLNVRHVLEGSVRKAGDRVRVTAQLIDARSDTQLWSETFDAELDDIFVVQDAIAKRIVDELRDHLGTTLGDPKALSQTENVEAYQAYLRGVSLLRLRGIDNLRQSAALLEEAVRLDPGYARAYAQLAVAYSLTPFYADLPRDKWLKKALETNRRAIELDPKLAIAHTTLASLYQNLDEYSPVMADAQYKHAIELDPGYVTARQWYGEFLMTVGKVRELRDQLEEAHRLDPLAPVVNTALAWAYLYNGDFDSAERFANIGLELGMGGTWAEDVLGLVYLQRRQYDKALEVFSGEHEEFALNRLVVNAIKDPARVPEALAAIDALEGWRISYWPVELVLLMGETELAFERALAQAEHGHGDVRALWRPHFVAHAHKPEFKRLVELHNLPQYWDATGWPDFCRREGESFSCSAVFYSQE